MDFILNRSARTAKTPMRGCLSVLDNSATSGSARYSRGHADWKQTGVLETSRAQKSAARDEPGVSYQTCPRMDGVGIGTSKIGVTISTIRANHVRGGVEGLTSAALQKLRRPIESE